MFVRLFYTLRKYGVPVTTRELIDLNQAVASGLVFADQEEFYQLAKTILVKDERFFDKFDRAMKDYFDGIETFDLDELLVRVEAVLRRYEGNSSKPAESKTLSYKNLVLDLTSGRAKVSGKVMTLTSKEFAILELMLNNPTKLYSKANLFESVWGESYFNDDSTVKVHMSNIRNKLKKLDPDVEYIETVWGMGYRLVT